ncbi:hypothetical protein DL771_003231 [Monosporascus sp. 5C6A]|nr:hypothetical protein DL771_003231 [Monosporascus sp. 5C6A]
MSYIFLVESFEDEDGTQIEEGTVLKLLRDGRGYAWAEYDGHEVVIPAGKWEFLQQLDGTAFEEQMVLGKGAFGRVTMATHPSTPGTQFVIKSLLADEIPENAVDTIWNEAVHIASLRGLRHVVNVVALTRGGPTLGLVMLPVANHNLDAHLQLVADNTEDTYGPHQPLIFRWIHCLARTLSNLHKVDIFHRDIKPENILVHGDYILYTDFGIAYTRSAKKEFATTNTGVTYEWMPPEAENYDEPGQTRRTGGKGDVWSLGCVFYEMLLRTTPRRLLGDGLPRRQGATTSDLEIITYHMTFNHGGGFIGPVEQMKEETKEMDESLSDEDAAYFGLTKDLLTIVTQNMLVSEDERADVEVIVQLIMAAMAGHGLQPSECCWEGILGNEDYYKGNM